MSVPAATGNAGPCRYLRLGLVVAMAVAWAGSERAAAQVPNLIVGADVSYLPQVEADPRHAAANPGAPLLKHTHIATSRCAGDFAPPVY